MIKLGITGGIGSGKSTVCKVFTCLNVPVYNADDRAKFIVQSHKDAISQIKNLFGADLYEKDVLDRKRLAAIVFENKNALQQLNAIVHPLVSEDFSAWLNEHNTSKLVVKEAAILFESGAYLQMDKIACVTAPYQMRLDRVAQRDHTTTALVKKRMENQMSEQEKVKRSDFVIVNDETQLLVPQIKAIIANLVQTI